MSLLISIPTYKRIEKLKRLLKSLESQTFQDFIIHVVCDNNDLKSAKIIKELYPHIYLTVHDSHKFVIGTWNLSVQQIFIDGNFSYFCGFCDDVSLPPEALQEAVLDMEYMFPDTDGVIGFRQECPGYENYTFKWFGQTLMGRKFIERYKEVNYQICCPDYKHFFQDEEMGEFASSLGKFHRSSNALLYHYHPGFIKEEKDETHDIVRSGNLSPKKHDEKIRELRIKANYLWGRTWNLIGDLK